MTTTEWLMQILRNLLDLNTLISIIIIIIASMIIIKLADKFLLKIEKKYDINLTAHYLLKDIIKYGIIIIALALILNLVGIDLQSIILSLGIVSIVIGFASKDIVSNFISGIFIIGDQNIQVGETIEVDGRKGAITKVGFRNTTMIGLDNFKVTIPNSVLATKTYKNFPKEEDYRLRVEMILPHGLDLFEFKEKMDETMAKYDWINKRRPSVILGREIIDYGSKIELSYWVNDYNNRDHGRAVILEESDKIIYDFMMNEENAGILRIVK